MIKRRAILHIGTEKTGTTTIQYVLARSRAELVQRGYAYSASAGGTNHLRLAAHAGEPRRVAELRNQLRRQPEAGGPFEQFPADLAREMETLPATVQTVIFSGEHCHSRLIDVPSVARLKALLDPHFNEYRIVLYLRRQDQLAASSFSTRLRNGSPGSSLLPQEERRLPYYDYAALLDRWAAVFGRESLAPRLFGRQHFVGGDLLRDFLEACGVGEMPLNAADAHQNPSLLPAAQEFLKRFNETPAGKVRPRPRWVFRHMNERFAGPGQKPSRAEAQAFVTRYAEGNERVRAAFFPQLQQLFDEDCADIPVAPEPVPDSAILEVALSVIGHLQAEEREAAPARPAPGQGRPMRPPGHKPAAARAPRQESVGAA